MMLAFSIGRTQELLYEFEDPPYCEQRQPAPCRALGKLPIYPIHPSPGVSPGSTP